MSKRGILIAAVVVLVAGAVGGAWYLHHNGNSGPGTPDAADLTPLPNDQAGPIPAQDPIEPLTGHLKLGAKTQLLAGAVTPTGATLQQAGFSLQFPSAAFSTAVPVMVSQAAIKSQDFGKLITPITPLYIVDAGDKEPAAPVTITIPAVIPAGKTAMAFSYDDSSGTITPLAPQTEDASSLTVVATHFSGLFGALVNTAVIPVFADSGFRPGKDDWEFVNNGSYVATGGHCDGQSLTAIWYYVDRHRKAGDPHLFNTFDNNGNSPKTPAMWLDDSFGYRFASTVQADNDANPFTVKYFGNILHEPEGRKTYETFRAAIATSGEPQLIWIGRDERHIAHAMIVYAVEADGLLIADPNYPGERRVVPYDAATGVLGPYMSGENAVLIASQGQRVYNRFTYMPWRSRESESRLEELWGDFKAGTIGNSIFPQLGIQVLGKDAQGHDRWESLTDGYQVTQPGLRVRLATPSANIGGFVRVFRGATPIQGFAYDQVIQLQPGPNALGFYVIAAPVAQQAKYVDFFHFTVDLGNAPTATPSTAGGHGQWVRKSATPKGGKDATSYTKKGESLKVQSSDGSVSVSYNYDGPPHRNETSTNTWGSPPAKAAPGDKWESALATQNTCKFDIDEQGYASGVGVNVVLPGPELKTWNASADCRKGSASTQVSMVFPQHTEGFDQFEVDVEAGDSQGGDTWTYTYVWQP